MGIQTGWKLWKVKPLWNCRKIQRNHGYRDTPLWRFPVDLQTVYSLGHKQGHEMFPEEDTNPATFVLTLKSQLFLAWHPKDFDELAPASLPAYHQHCLSPLPPFPLIPARANHLQFQQLPLLFQKHSLGSPLWAGFGSHRPSDCSHSGISMRAFLSPPLTRPPSFQCVLRTLLLRLSSCLTSFFLLCLLFQALMLRGPQFSRLFSSLSTLPPDLTSAGLTAACSALLLGGLARWGPRPSSGRCVPPPGPAGCC